MCECVAVVGGARQGGNCAEIGRWLLAQLPSDECASTELIQLANKDIRPCQGCEYECLVREGKCPVSGDDVQSIWERLFAADIAFLVVPTYGGTPPALWVALLERLQGMWHRFDKNPRQFLASVVLASETGSSIGEFTPSIVRGFTEAWGASECAFVWIRPHEHKQQSIQIGLVHHKPVQKELRRITSKVTEWLHDRV